MHERKMKPDATCSYVDLALPFGALCLYPMPIRPTAHPMLIFDDFTEKIVTVNEFLHYKKLRAN